MPIPKAKAARESEGMMRKDRLDQMGLAVLLWVTLLLAFNQIVIKLANQGFQPVFSRGHGPHSRLSSLVGGFGIAACCVA